MCYINKYKDKIKEKNFNGYFYFARETGEVYLCT